MFDQGDRIQTGISFADVADICVRALHDPAARNKTFEVAAEYQAEAGEGSYELIAQARPCWVAGGGWGGYSGAGAL